MGRYDDILRDIALNILGLEDSINSDVGRFLMEGFTEEGHVTKIFESNYDRYYAYVLDTVTGEVTQTFKNKVYDHLGNIAAFVEELTLPADPFDPCYQIPATVTKDDAMNLHKAGHNFNIRDIGGALYIDLDTGCRRPYVAKGSAESDAYFQNLSYENIYYEFTPEMFTDETPHAQDVQEPVVISSGGTRFRWDSALSQWVEVATGKPVPYTKDTMDIIGWGVFEEFRKQPDDWLQYMLVSSGELYYIAPQSEAAKVQEVYNWSDIKSGKDTTYDKYWLIWPINTPKKIVSAPAPPTGATGGRTTIAGTGGRPGEGPVSTAPAPVTAPVSRPVSVSTSVTPESMVLSWLGAAPAAESQTPEYVGEILKRLGVSEPKDPLAWFYIVLVSLVATFARLSNEPVDRAIRQYLNEELPNALPNPTDLVRFELREVFREEDRAKAMEIPPSPDFMKYMKQWGFDDYHAASYWAAHWELPSPIQAYEMFHRLRPNKFGAGVSFDKAELTKLLRVLDYRPDFIERLIQIAYQPITRVDIRRMWKMGVIETQEELLGRYLDLGYSPEDAKVMVAYTIMDSEPTEKTLSKSFYETEFLENRLSYNELMEAYTTMGYRPEDAQRMTNALMMKLERTTKQESDRREAGDRADKMLTTDQTIKAFKLGLLDEETAYHKLIRYGYDKNDAQILIDTAWIEIGAPLEVEKAIEKAERRTITEILQAYIDGETSREEAVTELKTIGRADIEITALMNVADAQRR